MQLRLVRKLADAIDGIDLAGRVVGDVIEVSAEEADLLVAEGWAELVRDVRGSAPRGSRLPLLTAADAPPRRRRPRR